MAESFTLNSEHLGSLPIVSHFLRRLGVERLFDKFVLTGDCRRSLPTLRTGLMKGDRIAGSLGEVLYSMSRCLKRLGIHGERRVEQVAREPVPYAGFEIVVALASQLGWPRATAEVIRKTNGWKVRNATGRRAERLRLKSLKQNRDDSTLL